MSFFKKNSPYIIAEIASAHEGNPDLAINVTASFPATLLSPFDAKLHWFE